MANELQTRGYWKWNNFRHRDEHAGPAEGYSLMQYVPYSVQFDPSVGFYFIDDFYVFDATNNPHWSVTEDAGKSGSDAVQDSGGGWYRHYADSDDNDESYVHLTNEVIKLQANKHLWFEARVKLTEGNTDAANFIVGLSENVGADHLQDDGAGPPASYDGIVWWKPDGTMSLSFEASLAAAQSTQSALLTHVSGHIYRLGAWAFPTSATTFNVYPWYVDESASSSVPVLDTTNVSTLTLTGHGEMEAFFGVKDGATATTTEEYIEIDYIWVAQQR